jgi:hypothetical protein
MSDDKIDILKAEADERLNSKGRSSVVISGPTQEIVD